MMDDKPLEFDNEDLAALSILATHAIGEFERLQAAEALRQSENWFRTIFDSEPAGVFVFDRHGKIVQTNNAGCAILGSTSRDNLRGDLFGERLPAEFRDRWKRLLARVLAGEEAALRYRIVNSEGAERWIDSHSAPLRDGTGETTHVLSVTRDMTSEVEAEETRKSLEVEVQKNRTLQSLGMLAGGIAHDFNNLLMGMLGHANLALLDVDENSHAGSSIRQIEDTARQAAELCNQMLAFAGRSPLNLRPFDLNAIVHETVSSLETSFPTGAEVSTDLAEDLPAIDGDIAQIRQVVLNLLKNAVDALGGEGGMVTLRTFRVTTVEGTRLDQPVDSTVGAIALEIGDTGCGMDRATCDRIFDPFFSTKEEGHGLGLAAVVGIVRSHGGSVTVRSEIGSGTTFRVVLPATASPAAPAPRPRALDELRFPGGLRVLIADDDERIISVTQKGLQRAGVEVIVAQDGLEAVRKFEAEKGEISCVLLDLAMPNMDGLSAYRELRRQGTSVPVLLMSGYGEPSMLENVDDPLVKTLQKPFSIDFLLETLHRVTN